VPGILGTLCFYGDDVQKFKFALTVRKDGMLQEDKERLEKHIRQEIEDLKNKIVSYKEGAKPVALDSAIGRVTRMDAINSKSMSEESLRKAKIDLLKLERALDKIDDPDFGLCMECGEEIPFKRLMIVPGSVLCVECAEVRSR